MNSHPLIRLVIAIWLSAVAAASGEVSTRLSTAFLARGEQGWLDIVVTDGEPSASPVIPTVANLAIQPLGTAPQPRMGAGRRIEYVFQYRITSYEVGTYRIPPITIIVDGQKQNTQVLALDVFNPDDLEWQEIISADTIIRYASQFFSSEKNPFENQTTATELKVYLPEDLVVDDWGIPDFERDGLTAWRFQPTINRSRINLLGRRYVGVSYPSTITPTRVGPISIGPAKVRVITREVILTPYPHQENKENYLKIPKLELMAEPLPPGAPDAFENAVGNFTLTASTNQSEIQEGDPITIDMVVSGSGNLDTLRPPQLIDPENWKVYGTNTDERGDERRQLSGTVVFHQSIRPLTLKTAVPPFRLVFFDPQENVYKTLTTPPLALKMNPNPAGRTAPTPFTAAPVPFEAMEDILAPLRPAQLTLKPSWKLPVWIVNVMGGIVILVLLGKIAWRHYGPRFTKDAAQRARTKDLRTLVSTAKDDLDFLSASGHFIEQWLGSQAAHSEELKIILKERDSHLYLPEKKSYHLPQARRSQILSILRKASLCLLIFLTCSLNQAEAADVATQAQTAYDEARYEEALELWLNAAPYEQLSADTLYNIGNACYRSGSPGDAALYYRRALLRASDHQEASQNLRFVQRKYGAITINRADYQYELTRLPLRTWKGLLVASLWFTVLGLLIFPATHPSSVLRPFALFYVIAGPLVASITGVGLYYYPDDAQFAPVGKQAIVIATGISLHTDASRTAPKVIDAPPATLCKIITISGRWAYVSLTQETRGWILTEFIEPVVPRTPPTAPKFRKPEADGKSA